LWNNTDVTVNLTATDNEGGSGVKEIHYQLNGGTEQVVSGASASITLTTGGQHTVTCWAVDNSENTEAPNSLVVKIDKIPPVVSGAPTTPPNANGWYNTDVTVHFEASDALSGIASITPDTTISTEGAAQSVTGTAVDLAGNEASFTVAGINIDKTQLANLLISSTEGGRVTKPGEGLYIYFAGTVVDLAATPDAGYRFVNWTGTVGTVGDVNSASTTITMYGHYEIKANFEVIPPGYYNLTISSTSGGSVTVPGEGTFAYEEGTVVNLVATPDTGYQFVSWTGNVSTIADVNAASTTIAMNADYSITVNFAAIPPTQYSLTISSTAGGSVGTPGEGTFAYYGGTVVNLAAIPDVGYQFVNWSGDLGTVADVNAASTTMTIRSSCSIRANFSGGWGCFIATAAYGTPMAEELGILRQFRDDYLLTNPVGEALVDVYYRVSPPIAAFITEHPGLKPVVRGGLAPAVAISSVAVNTAPAEKAAIIGMLVLFSVALAVWLTSRRNKGPKYT
jgi:hypothetical protein